MLAPPIANETFQFACRRGLYILKTMCAVQHVQFAQRRIRIAAVSFSRLLTHKQTFGGASSKPKYHVFVRYTPPV